MNYTLLILFLLAIYKFTEQKENFEKLKTCRDCRIELSKEKRKDGEEVDPIKIFKECINKKHCVKNDICTYCVKRVAKNTEDSSTDPSLIKTIKEYTKEDGFEKDVKVDLNNCKKFRYCRDEFENGMCNTEKWNKIGGERYCCNPCISEIRKNIDEADESALNIAKTCMNNLKLDENILWKNEFDIKQGVCSLKTIQNLKDIVKQKKQKKNRRRIKNLKRQIKRSTRKRKGKR
jgi:hypothetical protein